MSLRLAEEKKRDSPQPMSWGRHVSNMLLSQSWGGVSYQLRAELRTIGGPTYGAIFELDLLWITACMIWYICTNSYGDILLAKVSFRSEVVTSGVVATSVLTFAECQCHTSSIWPWSGMPKVCLYNTFLGSLRHLPPLMKNQHGLNEEKKYIGKKIISHLSACDVTRVVSLDTNNLKRKSLWE